MNATPDIKHGTIWEIFKAYIRGQSISYTSFEKNKQRRYMTDLTARISQLEHQYINNPSFIIFKEYLLLKANFDTLSTVETIQALSTYRSCL